MMKVRLLGWAIVCIAAVHVSIVWVASSFLIMIAVSACCKTESLSVVTHGTASTGGKSHATQHNRLTGELHDSSQDTT